MSAAMQLTPRNMGASSGHIWDVLIEGVAVGSISETQAGFNWHVCEYSGSGISTYDCERQIEAFVNQDGEAERV